MAERLPLPTGSRLAAVLGPLKPQRLLPSAIAGAVVGSIGIVRAVSYAALIFSGPLAENLTVGVGVTVFGTAVANATAAALSAHAGTIASPLAALAAIAASLAAAIAGDLAADSARADTILTTVLTAIALSSLLTGLFLLVLGYLRLGDKIRLIPYPVVCGFMAGTGWLLVTGAVQVTADISLSWQSLPELFAPDVFWLWSSALALAIFLSAVTRRYKHYSVMPATLLGSIAVFYLPVLIFGVPLAEVRRAGWLLGPFPEGELWQPVLPADLGAVDWQAIAGAWPLVLSMMLVSLLSLLLSNSGIELALSKDIALNTELKAIGWSNVVAGLGSGMTGNQALPSTLLASKIAADSRLPGYFSAALCLGVLGFGSSFLGFFPRPILGALLLYLGIALLQERVYRTWFRLSLPDYAIVVVTLVAIAVFGLLAGTLAGFVLAALLFLFSYSRLDVAQQILSGATTTSNVKRSPQAAAWLEANGDCLHILRLQDYVFFGTADYLLRRVRERLDAAERAAVRFVAIDFSAVDGLDASGVLSFVKILRLGRQRGFTVVLTGLTPALEGQLRRGGGIASDPDWCRLFPDLDRGLAWCEDALLQEAPFAETGSVPIAEGPIGMFLPRDRVAAFLLYLQRQDVPAGQRLFDRPNSKGIYFIESGQVSVTLELPDGQTKRLETQGPGRVLGEMRFYDKPPLSTYVTTDCPSCLYYLDRADFERMKSDDPALANALQEYIIGLLCESLRRREQQLIVLK